MRLITGGASLIQFRDKKAGSREFYQQVAAALKIAHDHNAKLIINDRVDIAMALRADGVHLGQSDLPVDAARSLLGEGAIIGFSTHNIAQAKLAITMPVDYIAFGPVFNTSSRENPDPVVGLEALRAVRRTIGSVPLVAIGGITSIRAADVLKAGADALAMISELVADPTKIEENMRKMLALASIGPTESSTG